MREVLHHIKVQVKGNLEALFWCQCAHVVCSAEEAIFFCCPPAEPDGIVGLEVLEPDQDLKEADGAGSVVVDPGPCQLSPY